MSITGRKAGRRRYHEGESTSPLRRRPRSDASSVEPEPLGRRSALPNGRAVIGGLLIAVSGIGLVVAYQSANERPGTKWLVARHPVAAGAAIAADDLGFATLGLIDEVSANSFSSPSDLIGRIALHDLGTSELISSSDVGERSVRHDSSAREVSIELERARALNGSLRRGDLVDLVATGADADTTRVIVDGALVTDVDTGTSGGIGGTTSVRITLAIADEASALAIIDANEHDKLTMVVGSDATFASTDVDSDAGS